MLHDFKLRVFAFGDDIFAVHFPVRHQLANILHDGVIGTDRIGRDYVDVRELASHCNRFAAGDERCFLGLTLFLDYCRHCHDALSS